MTDFYPRSHVGNDLTMASALAEFYAFLSTFPRRERLTGLEATEDVVEISIHVPT